MKLILQYKHLLVFTVYCELIFHKVQGRGRGRGGGGDVMLPWPPGTHF